MAESQSPLRKRLELNWQAGAHSVPETRPKETFPATVPGSVQLDWARATGRGEDHYWFAENYLEYRWCEDSFWTYTTTLPDLDLERGQSVHFVSRGIDYQFAIFAGDLLLHEQEGMYTPLDIDVSAFLGSELRIRIDPAPKTHHNSENRTQANRCCKPPASYGWDWHPRLIPLGMWEDAWLEVRGQSVLLAPEVSVSLTDDLASGTVGIRFRHSAPGENLRYQLLSPDGQPVCDQTIALPYSPQGNVSFSVDNPELWWPHDHGDQPLYRWKMQLLDKAGSVEDELTGTVGFRRVKLVMNEGAWSVPNIFPKDRSPAPVQVEINGRRIFAKGSNWVSPRIFYSELNAAVYEPLLKLAKEANFNMLRCWGGCIVNKESFFELCDRMGILVWQEFPLACNNYPDDPHYLHVLEQESRTILRRLRSHPCLALWCGGNELFNRWSGMTDQSLALRLLNKLCLEEDMHTPFLATAPVTGMGHGTYRFVDDGPVSQDAFELYRKSKFTAYSETGIGAPSSAEAIRRMLPEGTEWPPIAGGSWTAHHGLEAWTKNTHFNLDHIERYFGPMSSLDEAVKWGQFMQAEGLRCIYEEARRQKPFCSMVLNWDFCDAWPSIANCSIIEWPDKPKPALSLIREACRRVLASARVPKFLWKCGDVFEAELWLLTDRHEEIGAGRVEINVQCGAIDERLLIWEHGVAPPNTNLAGPTARWLIPQVPDHVEEIILTLRVEGNADWSSSYCFPLRNPQKKAHSSSGLNV